MCTFSKPIVDGLEAELSGQAAVLRLDILTDIGREIAAASGGINLLPTTLVYDGTGALAYRQEGMPDAAALRELVLALNEN